MKKSKLAGWKVLGYAPLLALSLALFSERGEARPVADKPIAGEPAKTEVALMIPEGWDVVNRSGYRMGIDPNDLYDGQKVAVISRNDGPEKEGTATFCGKIPVETYRGKRIRITCQMKRNNPSLSAGMVCKMLYADENNQLQGREYFCGGGGSTPWQTVVMVADVSPETQFLLCGGVLDGNGDLRFTNLKLEVVDQSVPVTVQ